MRKHPDTYEEHLRKEKECYKKNKGKWADKECVSTDEKREESEDRGGWIKETRGQNTIYILQSLNQFAATYTPISPEALSVNEAGYDLLVAALGPAGGQLNGQ